MACPTCDHTMQRLGCQLSCRGTFWCPRCGTLLVKRDSPLVDETVAAPALVERCREFENLLNRETWEGDGDPPWVKLGINEAIHKPEDRTT